MRKSSIAVLKRLLLKPSKFSELVEATGFAPATVSEALCELESYGLIEKKGAYALTKTPLSNSLKLIASRYELSALLEGKKLKLLLELLRPKSLIELSNLSLSEARLLVLLSELQSIGAVVEKNKKYMLSPELKEFFSELKKTIDARSVEEQAIILFSDGCKLKKASAGIRLKGTKTAFSLFPKYGIDYVRIYDYWFEPEKKLSAEEIFVHALLAGENKKERTISLLFFIKNKDRMSLSFIKKLAEHYGMLDVFLQALAYLDRKKQDKLFLPWNEFEELANLYNIDLKRYEKFELPLLENLLFQIGDSLHKPMDIYLIGGCNLALRNIKSATKDIDIIVKNKKDFERVREVLLKIRFVQKLSKDGNKPSGVFEKRGFPRVDCFTHTVMGYFSLTDVVRQRAELRKYNKLNVWLLSPEIIILFKSITEREGDFEDIVEIIRKEKIDWKFLLEELKRQQEKIEQLLCLDVLDTFELVEKNANIKIPIMKKLTNLCLEHAIYHLCKEKPASVAEIKAKIDFAEYAIRNMLRKLVKSGKLRKIEGKPLQFLAIAWKARCSNRNVIPVNI